MEGGEEHGMGWGFGEETDWRCVLSLDPRVTQPLVLQHGYLSNESPIIPQSGQLWFLCTRASQFRTWELFVPSHGLREAKQGLRSSELNSPLGLPCCVWE